MPMGPIELADTVGLDICLAAGKALAGARREPPKRLDELLKAGQARQEDRRGLLPLGEGQAGEGPGRRRSTEELIEPLIDPTSPRRRRRSPKASSPTPIWSTPGSSSAPASRRSAAGRCTTSQTRLSSEVRHGRAPSSPAAACRDSSDCPRARSRRCASCRCRPTPTSNGDIFGGWIMAQVDIAGGTSPRRAWRAAASPRWR